MVLDFILLYKFKIIWYILPFILHICNLYHKPSRHTVSKAFSKSINAQKSFFFFQFNSIRNATVIITNSLTVMKYQFLNIFSWFGSLFYHGQYFYRSWLGCFIRNRNYLSFVSTWVLSRVYGGVRIVHLFNFLCCFFFLSIRSLSCAQCCLCFWISHSWLSFWCSLTCL